MNNVFDNQVASKFADMWVETANKMALGMQNLISAGEIKDDFTT